MLGHDPGGLVCQWGSNTKVAMSVHCRKSVQKKHARKVIISYGETLSLLVLPTFMGPICFL